MRCDMRYDITTNKRIQVSSFKLGIVFFSVLSWIWWYLGLDGRGTLNNDGTLRRPTAGRAAAVALTTCTVGTGSRITASGCCSIGVVSTVRIGVDEASSGGCGRSGALSIWSATSASDSSIWRWHVQLKVVAIHITNQLKDRVSGLSLGIFHQVFKFFFWQNQDFKEWSNEWRRLFLTEFRREFKWEFSIFKSPRFSSGSRQSRRKIVKKSS